MCRCQCLAFSAAATEGAVKREQEQGSIQTKTDARTLAYIMAALYSGLLNYKMTEMSEEEIMKIWGGAADCVEGGVEGISSLKLPNLNILACILFV